MAKLDDISTKIGGLIEKAEAAQTHHASMERKMDNATSTIAKLNSDLLLHMEKENAMMTVQVDHAKRLKVLEDDKQKLIGIKWAVATLWAGLMAMASGALDPFRYW